MIVGMNHFTIVAEDEQKTLDFYVGLLGMTVGHRPDLGFPGTWLYAGGPQAVLHMYFGRPMPAQRVGVLDHMAFTARDLKAVKARFDERDIQYDLRRQAGAGTWQLFSHDPNGAKVELDFDPSESLWRTPRQRIKDWTFRWARSSGFSHHIRERHPQHPPSTDTR